MKNNKIELTLKIKDIEKNMKLVNEYLETLEKAQALAKEIACTEFSISLDRSEMRE